MDPKTAQAIEELRKTKETLQKHPWIQGEYARTSDGRPVPSSDKDAAQFCLVGALNRSAWDEDIEFFEAEAHDVAYRALHQTIKKETGIVGVTDWNDAPKRRREEVLLMIDKTIAWLEGNHASE